MRRILFLFITSLFFSSSLMADATILGVVTDFSTTNPIFGATVTLIRGSQNIVATTTTAVDGSYSFTGVNPGQYTVRASAPGYQTAIVGAKGNNNATTIVNFALVGNPGSITGQVTDSMSAISGATVAVFLDNTLIASTTTNGLGNYTINKLESGSYVVIAGAATYQTAIKGAVVQAGSTTTVDFLLQPNPGTISGTVTNAAGAPIQGATVEANLNDNPVYFAVTDSSGNYTMTGVAPRSYVMHAHADAYQTGVVGAIVQAGQTTTVNFTLQPNPGTLAGTVTNAAAAPIAGAAIEVNLNDNPIYFALTDSSGNYTITGVDPGSYVMHAHSATYQTGVAGTVVQAGQTTTVNFTLQPNPGTLSGTVTNTGAAPIQGATVEVNVNGDPIDFTLTDSLGKYTISGIAPGSYVVHAHALTYQIGIGNATIMPNQATTLDFTLQSNPSTVQGQITDVLTGGAIRPAFVQVFQGNSLIAWTVTDNSGNYIIEILPSGNYSLRASARGYYNNVEDFSVGVSATVTVNLALMPNSPPRNLTGKVINNRFLLQADRIHHIAWQASQDPTVIYYRVYRNGVLLNTVSANTPLMYDDHNRSSKVVDTYSLSAVNGAGDESSFVSIALQ